MEFGCSGRPDIVFEDALRWIGFCVLASCCVSTPAMAGEPEDGARPPSHVAGEVIVKLAVDEPLDVTTTNDGTIRTGVVGFDRLNAELEVTRMERVFRSHRARSRAL